MLWHCKVIENYLPYVNSRMAGNTIVCPPFYFSLKLPLPILNFALKMEKKEKESLKLQQKKE